MEIIESTNFRKEGYKERCDKQLCGWVKGNPVHNDVDDECCPDFSYCQPDLLQPKEVRETFTAANDEQRESMLFSFLGAGIASLVNKKGPSKDIFICNGKDEINIPPKLNNMETALLVLALSCLSMFMLVLLSASNVILSKFDRREVKLFVFLVVLLVILATGTLLIIKTI